MTFLVKESPEASKFTSMVQQSFNPALYGKRVKLVKFVYKAIDLVLQKTLVPKFSSVVDTSTPRNDNLA